MVKTEYAFTRTKEHSIEDIHQTLLQWGIAVIPEFVQGTQLLHINAEFEKFMSFEAPWAEHVDYSKGQMVRVKTPQIDRSIFPTTWEIFNTPYTEKLAKMYMGDACDVNYSVFVAKDVVGSSHVANDMHFDVVRHLKYFLYLTDTTTVNGAFTCVPGSQRITSHIRNRHGDQISYKNRQLTRDLPMEGLEATPIEGEAGTMIIFDTEVFHRAGHVQEGERRIMRAHTRLTD